MAKIRLLIKQKKFIEVQQYVVPKKHPVPPEELIRQGFEKHAIDLLEKCSAGDQISVGIFLAQRSAENANKIIEIAFANKNVRLLTELEQAVGSADLSAAVQKKQQQLRTGRRE